MRTRCPQCATSFRITPEQLRAKAGKVRCGHCQTIFDAFDSLLDDTGPVTVMPLPPAAPKKRKPAPIETPLPSDVETQPPSDFTTDDLPPAAALTASPIEPAPEPNPEPPAEPEPLTNAEPLPEPGTETPEESTRQAKEAGLMAARELHETGTYDRWSAGTLVLDADGRIVDANTPGRVRWPFIIATALLALTLVAQLGHHFRTELVQRSPALRDVFANFDITIPLPRDAERVSIEASDLQADTARGMLVLHATLKNRSLHAQAWPALELTLTNNDDAVVTRRVLNAADYLPAKANAAAFAGTSEIGLRLWIESKTPAAGYRLYVFYP